MKKSHMLALIAVGVVLAAGSLVAFSEGRPLTANLDGASEAPGPGDPDGTGLATVHVNPGKGEVGFTIAVENILLPASAAHIHRGAAGVPGPVVVTLAPPDGTGTATGTATGVDRELALEIIRNPSEFYVNVHNTDFPGGAVRGQLH
jgi:hypothetical protein